MSLSKERPIFLKNQIDICEFSDDFGDLTPIAEFKGPKTPQQRQCLRNFLHWLAEGMTIQESAKEVVLRVLLKHAAETGELKAQRTLENGSR